MSKTYTLSLKIRQGRKTRSWNQRVVVEDELVETRVVKELVFNLLPKLEVNSKPQPPGRD